MSLIERIRRLFAAGPPEDTTAEAEASAAADEAVDPFNPFPEPVVIEFTDVLDLHYLPPRQVQPVVEEFLATAHVRGYRHVRIIHGKGVGVQRELVRSILARTPAVVHFSDAPPEAGGWGATVAELAPGGKRP
jgi:dsDNA-specific endonuclease/ATPase MutS2